MAPFPAEMAELDLPRGPRELFHAVHEPLARAFGGSEHVRFGGGTALAARWAHRHSVDVDLFVEPEPYRHFHWHTGGRFTLELTAEQSVNRLAIGRDEAHISFHGRSGHVSISPVRGLPDDPRSSDTPRGTSLPFETTAEILGKKLLYRMSRAKEVISQDLYDLAFARNRDPRSLRTALAAVRHDELREIIVAFDDHTASGRGLAPLVDPSDPDLEKNAFGIVRQLIREELHQRPPPDPERGPTFQRSR